MAIGSLLQIFPFDFKPSAPPAGQYIVYAKTDDTLYLQDGSGNEFPFASTTAITSLNGEATAVGPGAATITLSNSAVIGKVLTGFVSGPNSMVLATDTILQAVEKLQAQVSASSASAVTSLTGDVTGTGPGATATTVVTVGGKSASAIATSVNDTQAATSTNTASTIVKRDASGNFAANIITASLSGNATTATTSTNFTGSLAGDVTGTQSTTVVAFVGGSSAANVNSAELAANAATASNTASTIVKRNASGNFSANVITANLIGNVTGNVSGTASNVTGIVAVVNGGTNSSTALNNNRIIISSSGSIVETAAITGNRAIVSNSSGLPVHSITTDTEITYVSGVTSSIQSQLSAISGSAITALTGDVTATGPGSVASTVAKIQGTTVTGTTGSGNVVFSAAPTLTGLLSGGSASFSSTITASNLSGTNTGDVTITDSNSIDLTLAGQNITADLKISADAADSNYIKANSTIHTDGLHIEVEYGTPVQIGTTNNIGTGGKAASYDHVHAHGNQTVGTLHAAATVSVNGFMSSTDKSKLDTISATAATNTQILISDGTTYNPRTMSGNATITNAGVITVSSSTNFSGSLVGDVIGTQGATVVSTVGGKTAAQIATSVNDTLAATAVNTPSTIVKRDGSGNFAAGTITANLTGNVSGSAGSFTGSLVGDVTGTQGATVVSTVGGKSAAAVAQSVTDTIAATSANTASTIVKRDASGNFSAGTITASLTGNATNVTGIVAVVNGGTGASTAPAARVNLNIDERTTFSNAAYVILSTDRYVAQVGTMSAARIVTLPAANSVNAGQHLIITDESGTVSTTNLLTITAAGADTINGSATKTIRSAFGYIVLYSNGSNQWFSGVEAIGRGGTGISTLPTDGQLLIGSSTNSNYVLSTLTAGTGVSVTNASGSITLASTATVAQTTKTANYTILSTDAIIFCDTSGGVFNLTLPNPSTLAGKIYRVIDTTGSFATNNLTLVRNGSEKIEGLAASKVLQTAWGWFNITTNGTDWYVGG